MFKSRNANIRLRAKSRNLNKWRIMMGKNAIGVRQSYHRQQDRATQLS